MFKDEEDDEQMTMSHSAKLKNRSEPHAVDSGAQVERSFASALSAGSTAADTFIGRRRGDEDSLSEFLSRFEEA